MVRAGGNWFEGINHRQWFPATVADSTKEGTPSGRSTRPPQWASVTKDQGAALADPPSWSIMVNPLASAARDIIQGRLWAPLVPGGTATTLWKRNAGGPSGPFGRGPAVSVVSVTAPTSWP